jgi:hypothetical protein
MKRLENRDEKNVISEFITKKIDIYQRTNVN